MVNCEQVIICCHHLAAPCPARLHPSPSSDGGQGVTIVGELTSSYQTREPPTQGRWGSDETSCRSYSLSCPLASKTTLGARKWTIEISVAAVFWSPVVSGSAVLPLASVLDEQVLAAVGTHFPARAKHVIYLHMIGAPSQLDLFDEKPELVRLHNEPCPPEVTKGRDFRVHWQDLDAGRLRRGNSHAAGRVATRCPTCCRTSVELLMSWHSSTRCIRTKSIMRPHKCCCIPGSDEEDGRVSGPGSATGWVPRMKISRRMSSC